MNPNYFCVIMAGGAGTRFWPISRASYPKQFIDILGTGKTLLQQTFDRFAKICPPENIFIVTSAEYKEVSLQQLPQIGESQVLLEPARRNTAPCIAYANFRIQQINPNAIIVVAPSDHLILNEVKFINSIQKGLEFVEQHPYLLTLGIEPSRPDTGYGYIQKDNTPDDKKLGAFKKVKTFTEKPNLEMAEVFVKSKEFFWNAGIFAWSLKSIQTAFETHLPEMFAAFHEKANCFNTDTESLAINEIYPACQNISIDYGIMEKANNVYVLGSEFGWSDLGTWTSLFEHMPKTAENNAIGGPLVLTYNTTDTLIKAPDKKLVVVQGLADYVVVDTPDALLICKKTEEQQIRLFVNDIKTQKGEEYI